MLLGLIADLHRNAKLRARFEANPEAVAKQYGLSATEWNALRSPVKNQIVGAAHADLQDVLEALWFGAHATVFMPWIGVTLKVTDVQPGSGPVGSPVPLTVTGTGFAQDARLKFSRPGITVEGKVEEVVTSADGSSTMTAVATFSTPGLYDVTVSNSATESNTLPQAFEALATVSAV